MYDKLEVTKLSHRCILTVLQQKTQDETETNCITHYLHNII